VGLHGLNSEVETSPPETHADPCEQFDRIRDRPPSGVRGAKALVELLEGEKGRSCAPLITVAILLRLMPMTLRSDTEE
jgi:hypothetical protein